MSELDAIDQTYVAVESGLVPDALAEQQRRAHITGSLLVVASAIAFGLIPWWLNVAKDHGATAMGVLTGRFVIAALVLLVMRRSRLPGRRWPRGELLVGRMPKKTMPKITTSTGAV